MPNHPSRVKMDEPPFFPPPPPPKGVKSSFSSGNGAWRNGVEKNPFSSFLRSLPFSFPFCHVLVLFSPFLSTVRLAVNGGDKKRTSDVGKRGNHQLFYLFVKKSFVDFHEQNVDEWLENRHIETWANPVPKVW